MVKVAHSSLMDREESIRKVRVTLEVGAKVKKKKKKWRKRGVCVVGVVLKQCWIFTPLHLSPLVYWGVCVCERRRIRRRRGGQTVNSAICQHTEALLNPI